MFVRHPLTRALPALALAISLLIAPLARADETPQPPQATEPLQLQMSMLDRAGDTIETTLDKALDLIGIRYRRGGSTPESGFDCSGYVSHVFREGLGLYLPRSAKEMSKTGEEVDKQELKPGDLVFFNTMRRAFSHVGIYLGNNLFIHAPRAGSKVRVEDMSERYWRKRFNGARRVSGES